VVDIKMNSLASKRMLFLRLPHKSIRTNRHKNRQTDIKVNKQNKLKSMQADIKTDRRKNK
jgi:hypothetical protein